MAQFIFRYGVMNSSKTLNLLATVHNYESQNKTVILIKPETDTRSDSIHSRAGLSKDSDIIAYKDESGIELVDRVLKSSKFNRRGKDKPRAIIVDEVNFLTYDQVEKLSVFSDHMEIPVLLYGLKCDFKNKLFPGSMAAIEWADKIEEIKTTCHEQHCDSKATINMRLVNGQPTSNGDQVVVGDIDEESEISYRPVCRKCYREALAKVY